MIKKSFLFLAILFILGAASFWFNAYEFVDDLHTYIENGDLLTLEMRFTPEDILDMHRKELILEPQKALKEPILQFLPYLLLEVKYYDRQHKTREGISIWSLTDGEMVLNTATWEKTRGFQDTLNAKATPQEFRLLYLLIDNKGSLSKEKIQKELGMEQEALNSLINRAKQKHLIVVKGNEVILHFDNPHFKVAPQTKLSNELVFKPYREGRKLSARYRRYRIEQNAKAAFGSDFTIRNSQEIYLPVVRLPVQNPDGSLLITDWNALTGEKIKLL